MSSDELVWHTEPGMFVPDFDEVHVSVTFSWDLPEAERLHAAWEARFPGRVKMGGPATGERGGDFIPGRYLRPGYTITSRGCPNHCWFCSVPAREGPVRELPIEDGWNVLDDNLLACSESHVRAVFAMLARQGRRVEFSGGLEAARMTDWHADLLAGLSPHPTVFFAYDFPQDLEPLREAVGKLVARGMRTSSHRIRAYVLCGYPTDTMEAADRRMRRAMEIGVFPMAMLWRDATGQRDLAWVRFARGWANPVIVGARVSKRGGR
jgi:hypothetical protein